MARVLFPTTLLASASLSSPIYHESTGTGDCNKPSTAPIVASAVPRMVDPGIEVMEQPKRACGSHDSMESFPTVASFVPADKSVPCDKGADTAPPKVASFVPADNSVPCDSDVDTASPSVASFVPADNSAPCDSDVDTAVPSVASFVPEDNSVPCDKGVDTASPSVASFVPEDNAAPCDNGVDTASPSVASFVPIASADQNEPCREDGSSVQVPSSRSGELASDNTTYQVFESPKDSTDDNIEDFLDFGVASFAPDLSDGDVDDKDDDEEGNHFQCSVPDAIRTLSSPTSGDIAATVTIFGNLTARICDFEACEDVELSEAARVVSDLAPDEPTFSGAEPVLLDVSDGGLGGAHLDVLDSGGQTANVSSILVPLMVVSTLAFFL